MLVRGKLQNDAAVIRFVIGQSASAQHIPCLGQGRSYSFPALRYKNAGIMLLDLVPAASVQVGLSDAPDSAARQRLMGIIDRLNARHGRDTISFAQSGWQRAWRLRSEHHSPRYTTSWKELLRVG